MTRESIFYPAILIVAAVLMWGVLRIGSVYLQAATDVSGGWGLRPIGADESAPAKSINFEQSGRYLRATIDKKTYSLKMVEDDGLHQKLVGSGGEIAIEAIGKDRCEFESALIGGRLVGTRDTHAR